MISAMDLAAFRSAFGTTIGQPGYVDWLAVNGHRAINCSDMIAFRNRFCVMLP
jgi:hypothetical protein